MNEEFDLWQKEEQQRQEDYFMTHFDEIYKQYLDENFVLIYNTSSIREYIIPGTKLHKCEEIKNGKVVKTSYFER